MNCESCFDGAIAVLSLQAAMSLHRWFKTFNWGPKTVLARDPARVHPAAGAAGAEPRPEPQQPAPAARPAAAAVPAAKPYGHHQRSQRLAALLPQKHGQASEHEGADTSVQQLTKRHKL